MKTIAWILAVMASGYLLVGCADGCPDEPFEIEPGLAVDPEDCPEGPHVLRGDADGVPFACTLDCRREAGEATIEPGTCEGGAVFEERAADDRQVRVRFDGTPERVEVALVAAQSDVPLRQRELLGGTAQGCGGPLHYQDLKGWCRDGLTVGLKADRLGAHEFAGTADGADFRCTYVVALVNEEETVARHPACTGDVELVIQRNYDGERGWSSVDAFFAGEPREVAWSFTAPGAEETPVTTSGTLAPVYGFEDGCRVATAGL
jgi:hypothetical protein